MTQFKLFAVTVMMLLSMNLFSEQVAAYCCTGYSKSQLPFSRIKGYTIQTVHGICNIRAIIFHTIKNKDVCADPAQKWVMDRIQRLKLKAEALS
ncbi:C-C motif chemokine 20-like [Lepisosteus oculatus]|uniref:C-C motif chemokine 20-like n=1 Tax=Lepisosteus oculatus TaxID=7918 RepID=UPI00073FB8CD|nr:PREDICTED: C-C motif chemokine 20-like [Lepisosteus oculatus]